MGKPPVRTPPAEDSPLPSPVPMPDRRVRIRIEGAREDVEEVQRRLSQALVVLVTSQDYPNRRQKPGWVRRYVTARIPRVEGAPVRLRPLTMTNDGGRRTQDCDECT